MTKIKFALAAVALSLSSGAAFAAVSPDQSTRTAPMTSSTGLTAPKTGAASEATVWGHMVDGSDYMFSGRGKSIFGHPVVR